ncbi:SusC/RagA family TonB-linked outer membrane protein [Flavobacterium cerinum]|uniref:SusC/RagA family TonB-linked outer membrane protein n=1 Tax=Flavobacterium cerinum TaxID=2502784 RepID=A0ABY5IN56_9FLAO|nr:SusC/RagA family TonB-linked outer membrane protein [Flavobacterium cerinum]UUC44184.1 SusC/RagA family TonB-linked outer membrane protein [Flavobacterium cerinum]
MKISTKEKSGEPNQFTGLSPSTHLMQIVLCCLLLAVATFAAKAQNITVKYNNANIEDVFNAIKKQSGFQFLFTKSMLKDAKKVTIDVKAKPLQATLNDLFKDQPFTFEILDKTIVIKERKAENKQQDQSSIDVTGTVIDDQGNPLVGATVRAKDTGNGTYTDSNGNFTLRQIQPGQNLQIIYVGLTSLEIPAKPNIGKVQMISASNELDAVQISVSTGYQTLPKERATGSFTQVDNKTLNRNVGINIIDRLESLTSGLLLNRSLPNSSKIAIHGRSTLFASADPLIILDGFPYDGNLDQINPADIENISILKDAAAASIWGTRAGNGVVVITSKNGKRDQPLSVNINSTLTIAGKPDQDYLPQISSSDYVDLEAFMFSKNYYNSAINRLYSPISPAVELLKQRRNNQITEAQLTEGLNNLRSHNVRDDLSKYYYQPAVYQQYQMNMNGGSKNNWYYLSAGYDNNLQNNVGEKYDRLTLSARNTFALFNNRLKVSGDLGYNISNTYSVAGRYTPYTPYDRLADENGNALSVVTTTTLSDSYTSSPAVSKLLDWKYRPLDEVSSNFHREYTQFRINTSVDFEIIKGLNLTGSYQYLDENSDIATNYGANSFYTRNLINTYSTVTGDVVNRVIELGNIYNLGDTKNTSKIGRIQLNFNKTFSTDHEISAIAGFEGGDRRNSSFGQIMYGYSDATKTNRNDLIDPQKQYAIFYAPGGTGRINTSPNYSEQININQSFYANASYTYKQRYILSGSARQDKSNLFGVNTNQKGVPLWSAGLAWIVNKEDFYHLSWFPSLKIRATFGYSGNVDKTITGFLTLRKLNSSNDWGSQYSEITNPPNPDLKWEQVKTYNIGIDFATKENRISGSVDLYQKSAFDLIGNSPIAMQSGLTQFKGNSANLRTRGIDVILNSRNLIGQFAWNTSLLFNYNTDKVTNYKVRQSSNENIISSNANNPLEGYPYHAIYSYPYAGLDATGSPMGYFKGELSKNYATIINTLDPSQIKYHGSASPRYFGSVMNTFSYKNLELSINISFKLDYYFRRSNVFLGQYSTALNQYIDYEKRWQKPGDELTTRVPALFYPVSSALTSFYRNSADHVERGDHIRLQDVRIGYSVAQKTLKKLPFKAIYAFAYAKNLGLIWRKNNIGVDPDYGTRLLRDPLSLSFGLNLKL